MAWHSLDIMTRICSVSRKLQSCPIFLTPRNCAVTDLTVSTLARWFDGVAIRTVGGEFRNVSDCNIICDRVALETDKCQKMTNVKPKMVDNGLLVCCLCNSIR